MALKRNQKTDLEIKKIKKACELGEKVFDYILPQLKVGITEKQAAYLIRAFIRKNGASLSFKPIVSFGKNSFEFHHKPSDLKLQKNHGFVMIDLGTKLDGYCSDMTRTVFMGTPSEKQKRIYETVLTAQTKSFDLIQKSIKNGKLVNGNMADGIARKYIISKGFPNIPHTVGHGIGKRVHEGFRLSPKSKTILKERMVFSIEPGIYLKNFGGVRIEDLYLITKTNVEKLTHSSNRIIVLD